MVDMTVDDIAQTAEKLDARERAALIERLQMQQALSMPHYSITREEALAELERRKAAGMFANVESLFGKYARPGLDIDEQALDAYLREIGTEWERELDDPTGEN